MVEWQNWTRAGNDRFRENGASSELAATVRLRCTAELHFTPKRALVSLRKVATLQHAG